MVLLFHADNKNMLYLTFVCLLLKLIRSSKEVQGSASTITTIIFSSLVDLILMRLIV